MEQLKSFVYQNLKKYKIARKYDNEIDEMFEKNILNTKLPVNALYNTFILNMSKNNPIFSNILKKQDVFDLTCYLDSSKLSEDYDEDKIRFKIEKSFRNRMEYVYIDKIDKEYFIGIKLSKEAYLEIKNSDVEEYLYPYKFILFDKTLKITDFRFDQFLCNYNKPKNIQRIYAEFIEHLKVLNLPLSIVSDDILFENTNILPIYDVYLYLESSSKWPKDIEAIDCAKTAFYCQMYLGSKFRHTVKKDYCIFKYKGFYFKTRILIKNDLNIKYNIQMGLDSIVKRQTVDFQRKIHMVKTIFAKIGVYPLHFDDFFIEVLCLIVGTNTIGDARFLEKLFNFEFDLNNKAVNLETEKMEDDENRPKTMKIKYKDFVLNYRLPDEAIWNYAFRRLKDIKMPGINDDFVIETDNLFNLDTGFDVVFSRAKLEGFEEIVGLLTDDFDLGTADFKEFVGTAIFKTGTFYYDPLSRILAVNINEGLDAELITNILILQMSFDYVKKK